jgi:alpha-L-fucosidase
LNIHKEPWLTLSSFIAAQTGDIRFTQTEDAFYIFSLTEPAESLVIDVPLPILAGDSITMIGAGNGTELEWTPSGDGIETTVPTALAEAGKYCWVFKIGYVS